MTDNAIVTAPSQVGGMLVNNAGQIDVSGARPWVENGQTYINVNGKAYAIQTNGLLQKDEWISYDSTVRRITEDRLVGIADLQAAGLVYNAGDLGSTIAEWEASSDMTDAEANMAGVTMTEKDSMAFQLAGVPIPVIRKDFTVNIRRLLASRRVGASIDTMQAALAARKVAEKSEEMLFNGLSSLGNVSGYTVYGYTTHPNRVTGAVVDYTDTAGVSGADIVDNVLAMIADAEGKQHYGPYNLYIPSNFWPRLRADYSDNKGDNTILERIEAIPQIRKVAVADRLTDSNVVLVQMTPEVVDLAVAQDVTTVQWERGDGMQTNFAVMAAWAPRIKADHASNLGIVHYS